MIELELLTICIVLFANDDTVDVLADDDDDVVVGWLVVTGDDGVATDDVLGIVRCVVVGCDVDAIGIGVQVRITHMHVAGFVEQFCRDRQRDNEQR